MTWQESIPYPENCTGIRHTMIKKNGKTIGWNTEYLSGTMPAPLSLQQILHYQRQRLVEAHTKDWSDLIRDVKEDDLINERIAKQIEDEIKNAKPKRAYTKPVNWQKPLSPWLEIWNKDKELRELFGNNYRHMRCVANKKNYTRDWVYKLKQEEREAQAKRNKLEF